MGLREDVEAALDVKMQTDWPNAAQDHRDVMKRIIAEAVVVGAGGGGTFAQSELTAATNFAAGPVLLPHPTDHELAVVTRPDANTWQPNADGLYEIKYEYDFGLPTTSGVTCECRVLKGGTPIAQSIVREGMHTVTGQDQIVHPGFLVTLLAADQITIDADIVVSAAATWNITRGHFQIRKVG